MKILTVMNQKGGVGKSTTVQNIGAGLTYLHKKKVLFIDLDAQGNLTYGLGGNQEGYTILDVLINKCSIDEAIQSTPQGDLICSHSHLSVIDTILEGNNKEYALKEAIKPILSKYDYILIDTPPSLSLLSVNALISSDSVIIPSQADIYSLQGIGQLAETIKAIKDTCNPKLEVKGIVLTRYNSRSLLTKNISNMLEDTAKSINTKLFTTPIREGIAVKEAQAMRKNLFEYAPKSNPAVDYKNLIKEVLV